jgi:hypothetical protein
MPTILVASARHHQTGFVQRIRHVVRSLAYFGDAESGPLPLGLPPSDWQRMRSDFEQWVSALG